MDLSKAIHTTYALSKDAFKPGRAYRILIHEEDTFLKCVTGLGVDDDNADVTNLGFKRMMHDFNEKGYDAICVHVSESEAIFISSHIGFKSNELHQFKIRINADIIKEILDSDVTMVKPDVEIFETKAVIPAIPLEFKPEKVDKSKTEDIKKEPTMTERFIRGDFCGGIVKPGEEPHKKPSSFDRLFGNTSFDRISDDIGFGGDLGNPGLNEYIDDFL